MSVSMVAAPASIDGPSLVASVSALLGRYVDRSELVVGYLAHKHASPQALALKLDDDQTFEQLGTAGAH